jgi:hypothetical protein
MVNVVVQEHNPPTTYMASQRERVFSEVIMNNKPLFCNDIMCYSPVSSNSELFRDGLS